MLNPLQPNATVRVVAAVPYLPFSFTRQVLVFILDARSFFQSRSRTSNFQHRHRHHLRPTITIRMCRYHHPNTIAVATNVWTNMFHCMLPIRWAPDAEVARAEAPTAACTDTLWRWMSPIILNVSVWARRDYCKLTTPVIGTICNGWLPANDASEFDLLYFIVAILFAYTYVSTLVYYLFRGFL